MDDTPNQLGYRSSRCSIEELEREEGLERKKRILERDNAIVRIVIQHWTDFQKSTDKDVWSNYWNPNVRWYLISISEIGFLLNSGHCRSEWSRSKLWKWAVLTLDKWVKLDGVNTLNRLKRSSLSRKIPVFAQN